MERGRAGSRWWQQAVGRWWLRCCCALTPCCPPHADPAPPGQALGLQPPPACQEPDPTAPGPPGEPRRCCARVPPRTCPAAPCPPAWPSSPRPVPPVLCDRPVRCSLPLGLVVAGVVVVISPHLSRAVSVMGLGRGRSCPPARVPPGLPLGAGLLPPALPLATCPGTTEGPSRLLGFVEHLCGAAEIPLLPPEPGHGSCRARRAPGLCLEQRGDQAPRPTAQPRGAAERWCVVVPALGTIPLVEQPSRVLGVFPAVCGLRWEQQGAACPARCCCPMLRLSNNPAGTQGLGSAGTPRCWA